MALTLHFEPIIPWLALALLGVVVLGALAFMVWRFSQMPWLRAALGALLLAVLANPVLLQEDRQPVKTTVALLVDESASQNLPPRMDQTQAAAAELEARLMASGLFDVRRVPIESRDAKGRDRTAVADALNLAIQDVPPARFGGAVLVTDGQVHDAENLPTVMAGAPLHSLLTGREGEIDQRVRFINPQPFAIVGQPMDLTIQVDWDGMVPTGEDFATIAVRVDGEEISFESVPIGEPVPLDISLTKAGPTIIEVELEPLEGELTALNNRAIANVDGVRENLRVLLVSGEPHPGERTWRNLLKSDASVDLVHFTILRPPEKQDGTPINELALIAFPTRELFVEKIQDFDLIVFDRYQYRNVLPFLYYDYIAQYVQNGGALLVAAGPEFAGARSIANTPLVTALPGVPDGNVTEAPFYPKISTQGLRHPVTRDLEGGASEPPEWSRWFRLVGAQNIEGEVVMEGGNGAPLLVLNRYGEGRVGMFLSDQGWLWARGFEGGGPHVALYRRIAHWLMKEPELEEERLIGLGVGDRLTVRRQSMAEEVEPATIIAPDGTERSVALRETRPGIFEATLENLETGLYTINHSELSTLAHVGPVDAPEFTQMVSSQVVLASALADVPHTIRQLNDDGTNLPLIVPVEAGRPIEGRGWIGLNRSRETVLQSVERYSLLSGPIALLLLLSLSGLMWYRERR